MNLKSGIKNLFASLFSRRLQPHFAGSIFGQNAPAGLQSVKSFMLLPFARRAAICFCWSLLLAIPSAVFGQSYYTANGTEYAAVGLLPGDQVFPDAAVNPSGGFMVWQDNITDGDGWGVSARRLDGTLSGTLGAFRVNAQGAGDQENPRVALLKNGGAVFVWQGGSPGRQHIYARFLTSTNTFLTTNDVPVSTFTNNFQMNPAVTVLNNSNVVVVWSSYNEASSTSLQDVYGQILSPSGQKIGGEFLINQFVSYNQRTPSVAALGGGGFVAAWVSEQERNIAPVLGTNSTYTSASAIQTPSVDIYARLYNSNGVAQGNEFLVNADANPAANPSVAAASDGSYMVAWGAHDMTPASTNSWDIYARSFTNASGGAVLRVNSHLNGDQYAPRISSIGTDYLIVWTSLGQDGSREGVFGQYVHEDGSLTGGEFGVNTTTVGQQMQPVVVSDGAVQFLAVWTGFSASSYNFDLFAQRYINVSAILQPMAAPFVWAPFVLSNGVYQPQLVVSWPPLLGISVSNFEVYVDGAAAPAGVLTSNQWTMAAANGLTAGSAHSFTVDYVTTDGRRSPLSPSAGGAAWSGLNWGGIPFEWMQMYFGTDVSQWPPATADSDHDGMNNLQEFMAGTIPTNAASVLRTQLTGTAQGFFLSWNTQPGLTYQVQTATNFASPAWSNLGAPRFAAGTTDSIFVGAGSGGSGYYHVVLLRQ
jgi:hypothetical protein